MRAWQYLFQEFWLRASRGELSDGDWLEFIRASKISASVDFPMSLYWRDLARLQPEAKVILTVRDPVRWFHSVSSTIRSITRLIGESWLGLPFRLLFWLKCQREQPFRGDLHRHHRNLPGPRLPRGHVRGGGLRPGDSSQAEWTLLIGPDPSRYCALIGRDLSGSMPAL